MKLCIDFEAIINNLKGGKTNSVAGWQLIQKIQSLLESNWEVKVCRRYREANQ